MTTLFQQLADILNQLDHLALAMEPGPLQQRLADLVTRLDAVVDATVGLETPAPPEEE